jgi:translation initiation factor RLI1
LILDDFASHPLLRSKETELSRLLKKLRHFNITVLLCVQTVKSLPKDIKRTVSDVVLFPGISEEDFDNLMKEINAGFVNRKDLYNIYKNIKDQHANLRLHLAAKRILMNSSKKAVNDKINEDVEKLMS